MQKSITRLSRESLQIKPSAQEDPEEAKEEIVNSTNQKIPQEPDNNIIKFSEKTQRKIVNEPIFESVFKDVEIKLRNIISTRKLSTDIDVECKFDEEISTWNKCVLTIHPPSDLNFEQRMNISTIFDVTIRKVINEMKKNADPRTSEYLKDLNRNLFVHVDL